MKTFLLLMLLTFSVQASDTLSWNKRVITTCSHIMIAFSPPELTQANILNIFIEGDGEPGVALKLAQDTGGNSVISPGHASILKRHVYALVIGSYGLLTAIHRMLLMP